MDINIISTVTSVVSPIVALGAIWVNNNRAKKRDEQKRKDDLYCTYFNNVLTRIIELEAERMKAGKLFLEYIMKLHSKEDAYEPFIIQATKMQMTAVSVVNYGNAVFNIAKQKIDFDKLRIGIDDYATSFIEIMEYHDKLAKSGRYSPNEILNMTQETIHDKDKIVVGILYEYMSKIANTISRFIQ